MRKCYFESTQKDRHSELAMLLSRQNVLVGQRGRERTRSIQRRRDNGRAIELRERESERESERFWRGGDKSWAEREI